MTNILELLSVSSNIPKEIEYNKGGARTWSHEVDLDVLGKLVGVNVTVHNENLYFNDIRVVYIKCCSRTIDFTTVADCDVEFLKDMSLDVLKGLTDFKIWRLCMLRCKSDGFVFQITDGTSNEGQLHPVIVNKTDTDRYNEVETRLENNMGIQYREIITGNTSGTNPGQLNKVYRFSLNRNGKCRFDHKVKFIDMMEV